MTDEKKSTETSHSPTIAPSPPTPTIKIPKAATGSVRHHLELIAQTPEASTLEFPIRPEEACAILACMYAARETMGSLTEVKAQYVRDALALLEE